MSLGRLQDETDLQRWLQDQLRTPGILPTLSSPIALVKAGKPADSDFPQTPGNGLFAVDSTGPTLYARIGGSWVTV